MRPIRSIVTALLVAGLAVAVAGCGGSQPDQRATPASSSPAATTPSATTAPAAAKSPAADSAPAAAKAPAPSAKAAAPRIVDLQTSPRLTYLSAFAIDLPPGAGTVTVRARLLHATRLQLLFTSRDTGIAKIVDSDRSGLDGWRVAWRYQDDAIVGYLTVRAIGPGGTASKRIGISHPAPLPRVLSVTTVPALPQEGGFLRLPDGAGTLVFRVRAVNAQRVRFYLSPTGTGAAELAELLGEDANGRDGWTLTWRYQDQPLLAHLTVRAIGAGGAVSPDTVVGLYHPDPTS
jgi:hypothetical protein